MENIIYQTGILGMKWGVRRYQNKDGSLTEAGRKRYLNDDGSYNDRAKKELKTDSSGSNSGSGSVGKQKASDMSEDELKTAISRMNLEKNYNDLKKQLNPEKEHAVRNFIAKALKDFASSLTSKIINAATDAIAKKAFSNDNEDEDFMSDKTLKKIKDALGPDFKDLDESELKKVVGMAKNLKTFKSFLNNDSSNSKNDSDD